MGGILATLWNVWQGLSQACPPKSTFSVDQIPDLSGRVMLVTGASSVPCILSSVMLTASRLIFHVILEQFVAIFMGNM